MAIEFCPKCLSPRNMRLSTSVREQADSAGKIKKILSTHYHCEVCQSFVRGEESEVTGDGPAATIAGNQA